MQSFDLFLPTKMVFGKDGINELPAKLAPFGKKVLLTYGGGSIKKIGLYQKVLELLKDFEIVELNGIEPNPKLETVKKGAALCREHNIDVILSVGGGSVLDCSKHIACATFYEGEAWDLVKDGSLITKALPIVDIITLAATGSEYDFGGVITNNQTHEKLAVQGDPLYPRISFCDPTYTFTVPAKHTAAGSADIFSHVFEQYFVSDRNTLTDGFCEAMLRTVVKNAPIAIKEPDNFEARAQLLMASSFGCCGLLAIGRSASPWPCHGMEHELSAFYDITHGEGLAIVTPHWMDYTLDKTTAPIFAQYGENVFGLAKEADVMTGAKKAIEKTREFFKSLGLPSTLAEVGITSEEYFEQMAEHVMNNWWDLKGSFKSIDKNAVLAILKASK